MGILTPLSESEIRNHSESIRAFGLSANFPPVKGRMYRWVYEYSLERVKRAETIIDDLDRKATFMLKYLGPGSGFTGLAFIGLTSQEQLPSEFSMAVLVIAMSLILFAMFSAIATLFPRKQSWGTYIGHMLEAASDNDDEEAALAVASTGMNISLTTMSIVAETKSSSLHRSYLFFSFAIVGIFTAILTEILWR